jgi:uncharacterized SAM-binding protein YcdF (DUF218 family)
VTRLLALLLLAALAVGGGFLLFAQGRLVAAGDPARRTEGIAVLTGGADRTETGLQLLEEGRAERLIISGVARGTDLAMLGRVANLDVAPIAPRIVLGRAAATTRGNAAEIAAWAQATRTGSIRVVTAWFHMPRAMLELRRALPAETELVPHPVGEADPVRRGLLLREYGKLLGAAIGLSALLPAREEARNR